jgi:hypothetical protein
MLTWTKENGFTYTDERTGKQYILFEMNPFGSERFGGFLAIYEKDSFFYVNQIECGHEERKNLPLLDEAIAEAIEVAGVITTKPDEVITYKLNKSGVKAWCNDVVDDICDHGICGDYTIIHGGRAINLPDLADIHNELDLFLTEAEKIANEEDY